jgi:hypothetical protein
MNHLNSELAQPIWQPSGNMLCDGAVTHAFDAVPKRAPRNGGSRHGALCVDEIPPSH